MDDSRAPKPFRWGFATAAAAILVLICIGHAASTALSEFGPEDASGPFAFLHGMRAKDWLFVAFAISSAVFLWLQRASVLRFFRSMHVGVSLVALSGIAIVVGVLVPQIDNFEDPTERVPSLADIAPETVESYLASPKRQADETGIRRAFQVCTALHLNRAYKSSWFTSLLALLGIGIFFNTFRTSADRLLSMKKVGFLTVHLGVMTILVGGFISRHRTDRGILHLDVTEGPTDTYWAYGSSDKKMKMPFAIKADRFARKDWPTLEVAFNGDQFRSRLPEYTLWPGFEKDLDFETSADGVPPPTTHLEAPSPASRPNVGKPRFFDSEKRDDPKGEGPLAELTVEIGGEDKPALLKPDFPSRDTLYDPAWKFRVRAAYGADGSAVFRDLEAEDAKRLGYLHVRSAAAGGVDSDRVPFRLGEKIQGAGGYTVEVQEGTANFQLDPSGKGEIRDARPLAEQYPRSPAVWVNITRADGAEPEM